MSSNSKTFTEDIQIETLLRPSRWEDFIGQPKIKNNLRIILTAAKKRNEAVDHLLLYGPAGVGKTTLAHLIAREMSSALKVTSGAAIEKSGDLVSILSSIEENDVLFIDETHRLNRMIEEILYPAMESRKLHIMVGKGPAARMFSLDLPPFTLVAATTRMNLLSSPLRSRFGAVFHVDYYDQPEIKSIILRSAGLLGLAISEEAAELIAKASRFTPRLANRLLKRARDLAQVKNKKEIDLKIAAETLSFLEIDRLGLEKHDRKLLEVIISRFRGGPVGLNTLAAALGEDKGVIEEIYEPYLIKMGLLQRTAAGRVATKDAYGHLDAKSIK